MGREGRSCYGLVAPGRGWGPLGGRRMLQDLLPLILMDDEFRLICCPPSPPLQPLEAVKALPPYDEFRLIEDSWKAIRPAVEVRGGIKGGEGRG